jgi:hypothetical protein
MSTNKTIKVTGNTAKPKALGAGTNKVTIKTAHKPTSTATNTATNTVTNTATNTVTNTANKASSTVTNTATKVTNKTTNQNNVVDANIENFDFKCDVSKNHIVYTCYKNTMEAFMEFSYIDPKIPKGYFAVLRKSIDALKAKGYTKLVQTVTKDDWDKYLKNDKWKLKDTFTHPTGVCNIIECNIDDAIGCISRGLGFNQ